MERQSIYEFSSGTEQGISRVPVGSSVMFGTLFVKKISDIGIMPTSTIDQFIANTAAWSAINPTTAAVAELGGIAFDPSETYSMGDIVSHNGVVNVMNSPKAPGPWDPALADSVSGGGVRHPGTGQPIQAGSLITDSTWRILYIAPSAYTSGADLAADIAAGSLIPVSKDTQTKAWTAVTGYKSGTMIYGLGGEGLFVVNSDYTSGGTIGADITNGDLYSVSTPGASGTGYADVAVDPTTYLLSMNAVDANGIKTAVNLGNVRGAQGTQGVQGIAGVGINIHPPVADALARNALTQTPGLSVLQIDTGEFWTSDGTNWSNAGHLAGIQGIQGIQGLTGADGTSLTVKGTDTVVNILARNGIAGDMWIDNATGDGYVSTGGVGAANWNNIGGIRGPIGLTGATGANSTVQGPQGVIGLTGPTGANSTVAGPQGVIGLTGTAGLDGTGVTIKGSDTLVNIHAKTGVAGDMWIDTATGNGHVSDGVGSGASHWTNVGSIQGPVGSQGAQGVQGVQGIDGVGINIHPPVADDTARLAITPLVPGTSVLQLDTGDFWTYDGSAWVIAGHLVGPQGIQGIQGIQGPATATVQSDWNQANTGSGDFIKNKPTLPAALAKATGAEVIAGTENTKFVTALAMQSIFKYNSDIMLRNDATTGGDGYVGYQMKGKQFYGNAAVGGQSYGEGALGNITVGSTDTTHSAGRKLVQGAKSATFEQIIDKALSAGGAEQGGTLFNAATNYAIGDIVTHILSDSIPRTFICKNAGSYGWNGGNWVINGVYPFEGTIDYPVGSMLEFMGEQYAVKTSGWGIHPERWTKVDEKTLIPEFDPVVNYGLNSICTYQGVIYRNKQPGAWGWNPANWDPVTADDFIKSDSYATTTTGGTLKARMDAATNTLKLTNDGTNP